ncbi:hypothetical protein HGRIS_013791 [Hohenbuehelia grisea]|uniref:Uncharacterized protein n=1 Tax=Hohenbuehelia grisea TaxID=104357 RepID=A0ABR3IWG3_9AGAR
MGLCVEDEVIVIALTQLPRAKPTALQHLPLLSILQVRPFIVTMPRFVRWTQVWMEYIQDEPILAGCVRALERWVAVSGTPNAPSC